MGLGFPPFPVLLTDRSPAAAASFRLLYATMLSARLADPTGQYISLLPTFEEVDSRTTTAQAAAPASLPVLLQGTASKKL